MKIKVTEKEASMLLSNWGAVAEFSTSAYEILNPPRCFAFLDAVCETSGIASRDRIASVLEVE